MSKFISIKSFFVFSIVLVFLFGQSACSLAGAVKEMSRESREDRSSYTSQSSKTPKQAKGSKIVDDKPFAAFEREILETLRREDFDTIDRLADKVRQGKERFAGGYWKLRILYGCLSEIYTDGAVSEEMWVQHLEKIKKWKQKSPNSITARIALAKSYTNYGWFARGSDFAYSVTPEDADKLHERLDMSFNELMEAKEIKTKCPTWYEEMLTIAKANKWEDAEYDKLLEEAMSFEPDYYYYYYQKLENSLPRWGGKTGDLEKFAAKLEQLNSKESDIVYFLYISEATTDFYDDVTSPQSIKWEKVKNGYKQLEQTYGTDKFRLNQYALVARNFDDIPEAQDAFNKIGDNWDSDVFSKQRFYEMKEWVDSQYKAQNGNKVE